MDCLEKPELKREIKLSTQPLPMENATFVVHSHDTTTEKMIIAYDIAGNAIECSIEDILNNKYRPKPDYGITEEPKAEPKAEGKCFHTTPQKLTKEMTTSAGCRV